MSKLNRKDIRPELHYITEDALFKQEAAQKLKDSRVAKQYEDRGRQMV